MIKRMDDLGRIVIPKEFRKQLNIGKDDNVNIEVKGNKIIISKDLDTEEKIKDEIERLKKLLKK